MSPAIKPGDLIIAEGVTFLFRAPRRGEIVIFTTADISGMPFQERDKIYVMRLVGLPGDELRIEEGKLFVNGAEITLHNEGGPIAYSNDQRSRHLGAPTDTFIVPPECYFVLGDNSPNSSDSRYWGPMPQSNVRSRPLLRYAPSSRFGGVE